MQSVAFTAAPFFIIAAVWFVIFGLSLICTCLYFCCCRKHHMVILESAMHFHSLPNTFHHLCYADFTVENLNNVSRYLDEAKNIGVGQTKLPEDLQNRINNIQTKMSSAATLLIREPRKMQRGFGGRLALIILAAVMLLLAFVGFCEFSCLLIQIAFDCVILLLIILLCGFSAVNFRSAMSCVHTGHCWLASGDVNIHLVWNFSCHPQVSSAKLFFMFC
ncbi:Nitrate/nitrite transporter NarU [Bienertia sinuspersici]